MKSRKRYMLKSLGILSLHCDFFLICIYFIEVWSTYSVSVHRKVIQLYGYT